MDASGVALAAVGLAAAAAVMRREYFRVVLFAQGRATAVLGIDVVHVVVLLAGVCLATLTSAPAMAALGALGLAAAASSWRPAAMLARAEGWSPTGALRLLREIAPLAAWSTAGAATHWAFSHGMLYLVAARLDVAAVAAIAATRLLLMPVNLLSTGIGALMLPMASGWLHRHGADLVLRRLALLALALAVTTACYFALLWHWRDWIFTEALRKQFADRDALLLLWGLLMMVTVARDQLAYLPAAQGRFRTLTWLTLASAAVALLAVEAGTRRFGVPGALLGLLAGELVSAAGVVVLAMRGARFRSAV